MLVKDDLRFWSKAISDFGQTRFHILVKYDFRSGSNTISDLCQMRFPICVKYDFRCWSKTISDFGQRRFTTFIKDDFGFVFALHLSDVGVGGRGRSPQIFDMISVTRFTLFVFMLKMFVRRPLASHRHRDDDERLT